MNVNYIGSVAERFMQWRTSLEGEEDNSVNLFNAISIYIPASLGEDNIQDFSASSVSADTPVVKTVTLDNYTDVLQGELLTQWLQAFNDGTNMEMILYLIVFDDTGFAPSMGSSNIEWEPLSSAFDKLYHISFFKCMFSELYDGSAAEGATDDSNYFDMCLCLAYLCELETTLSQFLCELHVDFDLIASDLSSDDNACKIISLSEAEDTTGGETFTNSTVETRAKFFWGFLNCMTSSHTEVLVHTKQYMQPIRLGLWFTEPNDSGEYVGNALSHIKMTNSKVFPTGGKSWLNQNVYDNMPKKMYTNLDDKNCGYLISVSNKSDNYAEIVRAASVQNSPTNAWNIAKWIDYNCSQVLAEYATDVSTLTNPVLCNEETYDYIQKLTALQVQTIAKCKRLTNVVLKFPTYTEAKDGNSFTGVMAWSATYVGDLEEVFISGTISF